MILFLVVLTTSLALADGNTTGKVGKTGEIVNKNIFDPSGMKFTGYRIDAAIGTKIGFKMNDKRSIVGLTVPGKQDFIALREK